MCIDYEVKRNSSSYFNGFNNVAMSFNIDELLYQVDINKISLDFEINGAIPINKLCLMHALAAYRAKWDAASKYIQELIINMHKYSTSTRHLSIVARFACYSQHQYQLQRRHFRCT